MRPLSLARRALVLLLLVLVAFAATVAVAGADEYGAEYDPDEASPATGRYPDLGHSTSWGEDSRKTSYCFAPNFGNASDRQNVRDAMAWVDGLYNGYTAEEACGTHVDIAFIHQNECCGASSASAQCVLTVGFGLCDTWYIRMDLAKMYLQAVAQGGGWFVWRQHWSTIHETGHALGLHHTRPPAIEDATWYQFPAWGSPVVYQYNAHSVSHVNTWCQAEPGC